MSKSMNIPKLVIPLCKALDISTEGLTHLNICIGTDDVVVQLTRKMYSDVYDEIIQTFEHYKLVEK